MPRNSSGQFANGAPAGRAPRIVLGALVAANLIAAGLVMYPPGGSAESLERQAAELQARATSNKALLESTRQHVAAVEKGRAEGDHFLDSYFLARRTAYSTLLTELVEAADRSKIKPKEHAYATEPIEGSDTLSMMTISANYEGTYANLMRFVHEIDKSPRMFIIEGLTAAPQQTGGTLSVSMKIDAFVRDETVAGGIAGDGIAGDGRAGDGRAGDGRAGDGREGRSQP